MTTLATIGLGHWAPQNRYLNSMIACTVFINGFFGNGVTVASTKNKKNDNDKTQYAAAGIHMLATTYLAPKHRLATTLGTNSYIALKVLLDLGIIKLDE